MRRLVFFYRDSLRAVQDNNYLEHRIFSSDFHSFIVRHNAFGLCHILRRINLQPNPVDRLECSTKETVIVSVST